MFTALQALSLNYVQKNRIILGLKLWESSTQCAPACSLNIHTLPEKLLAVQEENRQFPAGSLAWRPQHHPNNKQWFQNTQTDSSLSNQYLNFYKQKVFCSRLNTGANPEFAFENIIINNTQMSPKEPTKPRSQTSTQIIIKNIKQGACGVICFPSKWQLI